MWNSFHMDHSKGSLYGSCSLQQLWHMDCPYFLQSFHGLPTNLTGRSPSGPHQASRGFPVIPSLSVPICSWFCLLMNNIHAAYKNNQADHTRKVCSLIIQSSEETPECSQMVSTKQTIKKSRKSERGCSAQLEYRQSCDCWTNQSPLVVRIARKWQAIKAIQEAVSVWIDCGPYT